MRNITAKYAIAMFHFNRFIFLSSRWQKEREVLERISVATQSWLHLSRNLSGQTLVAASRGIAAYARSFLIPSNSPRETLEAVLPLIANPSYRITEGSTRRTQWSTRHSLNVWMPPNSVTCPVRLARGRNEGGIYPRCYKVLRRR